MVLADVSVQAATIQEAHPTQGALHTVQIAARRRLHCTRRGKGALYIENNMYSYNNIIWQVLNEELMLWT